MTLSLCGQARDCAHILRHHGEVVLKLEQAPEPHGGFVEPAGPAPLPACLIPWPWGEAREPTCLTRPRGAAGPEPHSENHCAEDPRFHPQGPLRLSWGRRGNPAGHLHSEAVLLSGFSGQALIFK